ncbi:MAG TPA: hypothetical protein VMU84_06120, partial [Thermoanaerobaculia bacterium]|nr:hypothetical protein [Thermoanaerobaculia bacterium]
MHDLIQPVFLEQPKNDMYVIRHHCPTNENVSLSIEERQRRLDDAPRVVACEHSAAVTAIEDSLHRNSIAALSSSLSLNLQLPLQSSWDGILQAERDHVEATRNVPVRQTAALSNSEGLVG